MNSGLDVNGYVLQFGNARSASPGQSGQDRYELHCVVQTPAVLIQQPDAVLVVGVLVCREQTISRPEAEQRTKSLAV